MSARFHLLFAVLAAAQAPLAAAAGDTKKGEQLYEQRCGGCHSVDAHRIGPLHRDLFGRKVGGAADYAYSTALRNSSVRWDAATLDAWLANPERLIPGQRMIYSVDNAADRGDLIAYLRSVSK